MKHSLSHWLLILGAIVTMGGSFLIESAIILLLTPMDRDWLVWMVKAGIVVVFAGVGMLILGKRLKQT